MKCTYNTTKEQAALEYAKSGIPVFPLVENEKRPLTQNGFKDATTDFTVIKDWWNLNPEANIGIPTGKVTGFLVLDVDCKEGKDGQESLGKLTASYGNLPITRKHRTPSGGYHLIFKALGHTISCSAGKIGLGLDIRCDGGYIVAPPSIIDGRYYEVEDADVPIADVPEWLVALTTEKKSNTENMKMIQEGQRNKFIFDTALDCKRNGLSQKDVLAAAHVANRACVPPLDSYEVERTVDSASRYEINTIPPEIAELNKKHAVVMLGGKCRILNEVICPIFSRPDITLSTPNDFKDRYANRKYNGINLGKFWFEHSHRRQYDGIVFTPGKETPRQYNLWRGFDVEAVEGDCSLYLKHIEENICKGNKAIYNYVIGWMAYTVQRPDDLVGTSIVLKGKQGAGKGIFAREFGRLFGSHFTHISQSSHLTGKFNAHLKQTVLLFADEACWGGDKQAEGPLKALITEPTLLIEAKGQDPITVKNHVHVLVSSNNDWVVPCGPEERRFLVVEVSEKRMQDGEYFKAIQEQMDNGGRGALLFYLMNYDLANVDLRKLPKTEALFEMKMQSASPVLKFWYEKLLAGALDSELDDWNDGVILTSKLQEDYSLFAGNAGVRHKGTDTELGTQLRKLVPPGKELKDRQVILGRRRSIYKFPALTECREYFEKLMNQSIDWPAESVALRADDSQ